MKPTIDDEPLFAPEKFAILAATYAGAWGIVAGLTPKLVPLDLSLVGLGVLAFSFGSFLHAVTFPITDAVAEVWGPKRARFLVYIGVTVYAFASLLYLAAVIAPPAPDWPHNEAYRAIFSQAGRLLIASLTATFFAQLLDVYIFEKIKTATGGKWLWLRNNGSTAISQLADASIFYTIAFYGIIPNTVLPALILGAYLVKVLLTLLDTPMVYLLVRWLTGKWEIKGDGVEVEAKTGP
ncbi:MAG: queuosine precursor transporter [Henriciella sp.]